MNRRDGLDEHLAEQRGTASVSQLDAAGYTDRRRRRARDDGYLEKVGAHTYRSAFRDHSLEDDLAALVFDCGPDAWASGPTAAALHRFDGFTLRRPFHITVARGRNVQRVGNMIHTTTAIPLIDRSTVRKIPVTSPVRTVIDLGRYCSVSEVTVAVDSMIRDGGGSEDLLHRRLVRLARPGRPGIATVLAAIEGADAQRGGHSFLERRYLTLLAEAGLPRPETQVEIKAGRLVRVDCMFPGTTVIVELLGYRWHRTERQMAADARRMNGLIARGLRPIQFTYRQVMEEGHQVLQDTADALHRAA